MPGQDLTNMVSLPSAIQIDTATFVGQLTVQGSFTVTGAVQMSVASANRLVLASNIQAVAASFTGAITQAATTGLAVATTALSSDNAVAGIPGNTFVFKAVGTVMQVYFNQSGSAVLRGVVNLGTF